MLLLRTLGMFFLFTCCFVVTQALSKWAHKEVSDVHYSGAYYIRYSMPKYYISL